MTTTERAERPQPSPRSRDRRPRRWWLLGVSLAVLLGALAVPATSYVRALTYPGQASFTARTDTTANRLP